MRDLIFQIEILFLYLTSSLQKTTYRNQYLQKSIIIRIIECSIYYIHFYLKFGFIQFSIYLFIIYFSIEYSIILIRSKFCTNDPKEKFVTDIIEVSIRYFIVQKFSHSVEKDQPLMEHFRCKTFCGCMLTTHNFRFMRNILCAATQNIWILLQRINVQIL